MTFVGAVIAVLIGIILLVAVAIPITVTMIQNITTCNATFGGNCTVENPASVTTVLVLGLIPLFLALGGIMLVVKLYQ